MIIDLNTPFTWQGKKQLNNNKKQKKEKRNGYIKCHMGSFLEKMVRYIYIYIYILGQYLSLWLVRTCKWEVSAMQLSAAASRSSTYDDDDFVSGGCVSIVTLDFLFTLALLCYVYIYCYFLLNYKCLSLSQHPNPRLSSSFTNPNPKPPLLLLSSFCSRHEPGRESHHGLD